MSVRTILNNGASSNRVDIIFLGDGYTSSELAGTYTSHVNSLISYLFDDSLLTQPFGRYENFFNIHLIDVTSNESGADDPGTGTVRDTALNATYFFDGQTERLLSIDTGLADAALNAGLAGTTIDPDMRFVTVNSSKYGGAGGPYAVFAGGNTFAREVALHEVAHSFAHLADEYGGGGAYSGSEPVAINVTTDPNGSKWSYWHGYQQEGIGVIGAYEGGQYADTGIYRPSLNSKMRTLENPFDAISREAFILEFYEHVDPLDEYSYQGTSGTLTDIGSLTVVPIDTNVITVDWYVGGNLVVSNDDSVTMSDLGLGAGTHSISARAYDATDWVRADRSSLEQTVSWTVNLTGADVPSTNFTLLRDALTPSGLANLRDYGGNSLGSNNSWVQIGRTDVEGDGDQEVILVNSVNGRWATLGVIEQGGLEGVNFDNHGANGDTRVVGIYIDPLVDAGQVEQGGPFDSQTRFQNDLNAGRVSNVLGSSDYDNDGGQEVYFALSDGSAVLHAYMHADGNIRYANYQSATDLANFMTLHGVDPSVYDGWI